MDGLETLQEKIEKLIVMVKELKEENLRLKNENEHLTQKIASMNLNLEQHEYGLQELSDEKSRTKMALTDLIKSIDLFVAAEQ